MTKQFDAAIELQLDVMRTSRTITGEVVSELKKLERDLLGRIASEDFSKLSKSAVNKNLAEVRAVIKGYYDNIAAISLTSTDAIAQVSATVTAASLTVGAITGALPTQATIDAISARSVIQGAAQGAWWARQDADIVWKFSQAVRQGVSGGETNQQIIQRVRGFMDTSRANAAALVQTSTATIANDARDAVFSANDDIIKGYRAVATLDSHTCLTCAPLDGLTWTKDGGPQGHKFSFPNYPLHFNCRCLKIAVIFDGPQGGKRASSDGPVNASLDFNGWLSRQSAEKVESILGKGRAKMYQSGKLTITDLVTGSGRPLTISQLKSKYA